MKFQNCILINFVADARTDRRAQSNMPFQLFKIWGYKKLCVLLSYGVTTRCDIIPCIINNISNINLSFGSIKVKQTQVIFQDFNN